MISFVGPVLAIAGSVLSLYGAWLFNIRGDNTGAKLAWAISNPFLFVWAAGYLLGFWDGALSMIFVMGMYGYYTVTNWWGLFHVR